jgi:CRP-like cAMP-binding protein
MAQFTNVTGNLLLDALDDDARASLLAKADQVPIEIGKVYYQEGDPLDTVYLPISGVLSITTRLGDDFHVEAATVGREGFIVAQAFLGSKESGQENYMGQVRGEMIAMEQETFASAAARPGRLQDLAHGYVQALFAQVAYGVACNARHDVELRCARWLLQAHDRVDTDAFELRQEFLAMMLGVQRQTVTVAAGQLQRAGLIEYRRGHIVIEDREGLEAAACECYEKVRSEYSRLVPLQRV